MFKRIPAQWRRLFFYLLVGGVTSLAYMAVGIWLEASGLSSATSGFIAFMLIVPLVYLGHRWLTFESTGSRRVEFPRFIASSLLGLLLYTFLPWLFNTVLGFMPVLGFFVTCVIVPVLNYTLLRRFVFTGRS
ncbi:MAG: GtrA family protein [Burkholderiaceae bacterium]|nr:GtrA family protein [Burkholderiaceae bacterium]